MHHGVSSQKLFRKQLCIWAPIMENAMCIRQTELTKQQVRFRKPRSLGRAPTKRDDPNYFKKTYPTKEDLEKAKPIYSNYNIALSSLVSAFQEELFQKQSPSTTTSIAEQLKWDEKAHHKMCMEFVANANVEKHKERLVRLEKLKKDLHDNNLKEAKRISNELNEKEVHFTKKIEETERESEMWMTEENCEEKVVKAIDFPISVNFAVNKNGIICKRTAQTQM